MSNLYFELWESLVTAYGNCTHHLRRDAYDNVHNLMCVEHSLKCVNSSFVNDSALSHWYDAMEYCEIARLNKRC